jgi:hypothetical protein
LAKVEYLYFEELENLTGKDFNRLPFVKRHGFNDEAEYRIIAESGDRQRPVYPIDFQLSWINRIIINPWLPDTISKSVIATLRLLPNCANLPIRKSRLIDSSRWKKAALARNPLARRATIAQRADVVDVTLEKSGWRLAETSAPAVLDPVLDRPPDRWREQPATSRATGDKGIQVVAAA